MWILALDAVISLFETFSSLSRTKQIVWRIWSFGHTSVSNRLPPVGLGDPPTTHTPGDNKFNIRLLFAFRYYVGDFLIGLALQRPPVPLYHFISWNQTNTLIETSPTRFCYFCLFLDGTYLCRIDITFIIEDKTKNLSAV